MSSRRSVRQLVVAVLFGVLVGGGLLAVTPAGAEVSNAVATNWKKIWKKNLRPLADRRYYTKAKSDARYATKADSDAKYQPKGSYEVAGSGYTKAESDAKYSAAGSAYSKAEADAKYLPKPTVIRGIFSIRQTGAAGDLMSSPISFGLTLTAAPTVHMIDVGDPVPVGCSGTSLAPSASPGNLCVFVTTNNNGGSPFINSANGTSGASPFGAYIGSTAPGAGSTFLYGSWAVGVSSLSAARVAPEAGTGTVDGR